MGCPHSSSWVHSSPADTPHAHIPASGVSGLHHEPTGHRAFASGVPIQHSSPCLCWVVSTHRPPSQKSPFDSAHTLVISQESSFVDGTFVHFESTQVRLDAQSPFLLQMAPSFCFGVHFPSWQESPIAQTAGFSLQGAPSFPSVAQTPQLPSPRRHTPPLHWKAAEQRALFSSFPRIAQASSGASWPSQPVSSALIFFAHTSNPLSLRFAPGSFCATLH